ncbi:MAG: tetratricopeptide repeat protein [Sciscionella sp.]
MTPSIAATLRHAAELTGAGKGRRAVDLLRPVVVTYQDIPEIWCRLAEAQLAAGDADAALTAAKRGLACGGDPAWTNRLTSYALLNLGRTGEAVRTAREALRLRPDDWRGHVTAAQVLASSEADEALVAARHATRLAPAEPRTHEVLGDIATRTGDYPLAVKAYAGVLALDPGNALASAALRRLPGGPSRLPAGRAPRRSVPRHMRSGVDPIVWRDSRRLAVIAAAGSLLLILAGMPTPAGLLGWFGLALLLVLAADTARACSRLPRPRPAAWRLLARGSRTFVVSVGSLSLSVLAIAGWAVSLAFGAHGLGLLVAALLCAVLTGGISQLAVLSWRYRDHRDARVRPLKGSR